MTDDPCRNVRARAQSLTDEVALMRAVVAALRASSRRETGPVGQPASPEQCAWKVLALVFLGGVAVGALTLIALTRRM